MLCHIETNGLNMEISEFFSWESSNFGTFFSQTSFLWDPLDFTLLPSGKKIPKHLNAAHVSKNMFLAANFGQWICEREIQSKMFPF